MAGIARGIWKYGTYWLNVELLARFERARDRRVRGWFWCGVCKAARYANPSGYVSPPELCCWRCGGRLTTMRAGRHD